MSRSLDSDILTQFMCVRMPSGPGSSSVRKDNVTRPEGVLYTLVTLASSCEFLASGVPIIIILCTYVRMHANIASKTLHFATYAHNMYTYSAMYRPTHVRMYVCMHTVYALPRLTLDAERRRVGPGPKPCPARRCRCSVPSESKDAR